MEIAPLLAMRGFPLSRSGGEMHWRIPGEESVSIRGNMWYSHYRGEGGDAISFARRFFHMDFKEAVRFLLEQSAAPAAGPVQCERQEQKQLRLPSKDSSEEQVRRYLTGIRKVSADVAGYFIETGQVYQSRAEGVRQGQEQCNLVLVGMDRDGAPRQAHIKGMRQRAFRYDAPGSDKAYGFRHMGGSGPLYVFEAAIDFMSYVSLYPKDWRQGNYLALNGTAEAALFRTLEGFDCNAGKHLPEVITKSKVVPADKDWEFITKMTMVMRDILYGNPKLDELGWHEEALGKNAVAGGFQGQRNWTDWLPNADFSEAIMASTFDWNGPKRPTPFATENDTLNGVSMMLGTLVSGTAPCFHDVRTYWSPEACERVTGHKPEGVAAKGFIHLINSGATALDGSGAATNENGEHVMKPFWEMTDKDMSACLEATDWCRANYEYFRGGGFSSHFRCTAEMPVTMLRVNIAEGVGPVLQIAEGWTANLPDDVHTPIDLRTDRTWPTTWFVPRLTGKGAFKDVYSVMANWGANHGVTVYGHVGADLVTLASMLRIPVALHNVPEEKLYRPHAWAAFGTKDTEAADFAACKYYGPLYD